MTKIFDNKDYKDNLSVINWIVSKLTGVHEGYFGLILDSKEIIDSYILDIRGLYSTEKNAIFRENEIEFMGRRVLFFNTNKLKEYPRGARFSELAIQTSSLFSLKEVTKVAEYLNKLEQLVYLEN